MIASEPVLNVLLYSVLAAVLAVLGVLPFALGGRPRAVWIGGAGALAAGLMLGAGYLLMDRGLDLGTWASVAGGGIGVLYTLAARLFTGVGDLDEEREEAAERKDLAAATSSAEDRIPLLLLQHGLHAAAEGIAIGVAMTLHLRLGIFVALALAIHNIGEAMALSDLLRRRDVSTGRAAGLAVVINLPQPVLALAAFALGPVLTGFLPAALGFAAGALVFLVLTELVPEAYPQAGKGVVAFLLAASAGAVVLLESFFVG
jgi:ZIP family zinc transporter